MTTKDISVEEYDCEYQQLTEDEKKEQPYLTNKSFILTFLLGNVIGIAINSCFTVVIFHCIRHYIILWKYASTAFSPEDWLDFSGHFVLASLLGFLMIYLVCIPIRVRMISSVVSIPERRRFCGYTMEIIDYKSLRLRDLLNCESDDWAYALIYMVGVQIGLCISNITIFVQLPSTYFMVPFILYTILSILLIVSIGDSKFMEHTSSNGKNGNIVEEKSKNNDCTAISA